MKYISIFTMPALLVYVGVVQAADIGAICSGNWNNASIWTPAMVPGASDDVYIGSMYRPWVHSMSANVTLTQDQSAEHLFLGFGIGTTGILGLENHQLNLGSGGFYIGLAGGTGIVNRGSGSFLTGDLYIDNGNSLAFVSGDRVNSSLVLLNGSTATTASAWNVESSCSAYVYSGGVLTLGADMGSRLFELQGDLSTLDMDSHSLQASLDILIGWNGGNTKLLNRGPLMTYLLAVANQNFDLYATDSATNLLLKNSTSTLYGSVYGLQLYNGSNASTTVEDSVTGGIHVESGSILTAGANMTLDSANIDGNLSTLDMAGHSISADYFSLGLNSDGNARMINHGSFQAYDFSMGHENTLTLHAGDIINDQIYLCNSSVLSVVQADDQLTGLTLNGTWGPECLMLLETSLLNLVFGDHDDPSWIFRWKDPDSGGNWESALSDLISEGRITVSGAANYSLIDQGGYTYIAVVPEPSIFVLLGTGVFGWLFFMRRQK